MFPTMRVLSILAAPSILLGATFLVSSCTFWHDTVSFDSAGKTPSGKTPSGKTPSGKTPSGKTPVPKIEIDTNISITTLFGGFVKSKKPYDIRAYHMDDTFTVAAAEFTAVTVTYDDGTVDPGAAALKLPLCSHHTIYESYNSMGEEGVVVTKSRIIRAEFPGAINRDEPFTLLIEGRFTKDNGMSIPFRIHQKYGVSRDKRTESWADFVSGC
jgi:hypothetical protein